jgi:hypothetical protein
MTNYAMGLLKGVVEKDPDGAVSFFEAAVHLFPLFPEAHIG